MRRLIPTLCVFFLFSLVSKKITAEEKGIILSTFEIKTIKVCKTGMLCWTSSNEHGSLLYQVEQFIYNKWVKVGEVAGIGTPDENSYAVPVVLNKGENRFRIGQRNVDKTSRFSETISYFSTKENTSFSILDHNQTISFSDNTYYIIYNMYGLAVKQGYGNSLNIASFPKGKYFVIYDNQIARFEKKFVLFRNSRFSIALPKIS